MSRYLHGGLNGMDDTIKKIKTVSRGQFNGKSIKEVDI